MARNEKACRLIELLYGKPEGLHRTILMRKLDISSKSTFYRTLAAARKLQRGIIDCSNDTYLLGCTPAQTTAGPFIPTENELISLVTLQKIVSSMTAGALDAIIEPLQSRLADYLKTVDKKAGLWPSRIKILDIHHRQIDETVFRKVLNAAAHRRVVRFTYTDARGRKTGRTVSPQQLVRYKDNWYLDAWCHDNEDLRIFSLDNIIAVRSANANYHLVDSADLKQTYATSYGLFSGAPVGNAVLRFTGLAARYALRESWHPEQMLVSQPDGSVELTIPYNKPQELIREILARGAEAEIVSPQNLRDEIAEVLQKTVNKYRTSVS